MKYIIIGYISLVIMCILLFIGFDSRGKEIATLESEKQIAISEKEKCYEQRKKDMEASKSAQISSSEIIKKLRLEVARLNDNDVVDCYHDVMPDQYRELLEQLK